MSSAHLVSIEALTEFLVELRAAVASAQTEFEEMRRVVNRRIAQARATLDEREAALAEAIEDLRGVPDEESGRFEQEAVDAAQLEVRRAQQRLRRIEDAGGQFLIILSNEARSLSDAFTASQVFLNERIETGVQYRSIASPSAERRASPAVKSEVSVQQNSSLTNTNADRSNNLAYQLPPLPRRMQWVPIEDIDEAFIPSDLEFQKAPHAQMKAMMRVFRDSVMPALAENPSLIADDFSGGVGEEQISLSTTPRFAYECMLGSFGSSDVIVLDKKRAGGAGKMGITSGRHRILIAKELGWSHVPARVLGARHA